MPTAKEPPGSHAHVAVATLGGGCFWCIEAVLERVDGVLDVVSGYAGGTVAEPIYEQVCAGSTGHAEVVQVTFDPAKLSYPALLEWFFRMHDPTTPDRQGPDVGSQYRSAIFCHSDEQLAQAREAIAKAKAQFRDPIVTEVARLGTFWPAEDHHQDYFARNPANAYCRTSIPPKLKKLGLDR